MQIAQSVSGAHTYCYRRGPGGLTPDFLTLSLLDAKSTRLAAMSAQRTAKCHPRSLGSRQGVLFAFLLIPPATWNTSCFLLTVIMISCIDVSRAMSYSIFNNTSHASQRCAPGRLLVSRPDVGDLAAEACGEQAS